MYVFVLLILLFFFRLDIIPFEEYSGGSRFLALLLLFFLIFKKGNIFKVQNYFNKELKLYLGFILLNCLTCYFFRGQSVFLSIQSWQTFFLILLYPLLMSRSCTLSLLENILFIFFVIIVISYIIQYIFIDYNIFLLDVNRFQLGIDYRLRIFSDGILYLGSLFCWNKFICKGKALYFFLFFISIVLIFLQGYRILLFASSICYMLLYFRIKGMSMQIVMIALLGVIAVNFAQDIPVVANRIEDITGRNELVESSVEDYIRIRDIEYTYSNHFKNNLELLCGSGMTILSFNTDDLTGITEINKPKSEYARYMTELFVVDHYIYIDLGIFGLSWMAGIPFVLVLLFIMYRVLRLKVETEYYYCGMFMILCFIGGFTNALIYKHHNMIWLAIILCIVDLAHRSYLFDNRVNDSD